MNRTSQARFFTAAAMLLGLTAGGAFTRPAQGDAVFAPAQPYPVGDGPIDVTVADVDGDGALDVISSNSHSGDLSLLLNNGDGTLAPEVRLGPRGAPRRVAVGDIDGDGDADLVATIAGPGTIAVFLA
ncbi:MAG: FG-GAP repeat domain-containing protein, partial [Planctomycetota bacterium]